MKSLPVCIHDGWWIFLFRFEIYPNCEHKNRVHLRQQIIVLCVSISMWVRSCKFDAFCRTKLILIKLGFDKLKVAMIDNYSRASRIFRVRMCEVLEEVSCCHFSREWYTHHESGTSERDMGPFLHQIQITPAARRHAGWQETRPRIGGASKRGWPTKAFSPSLRGPEPAVLPVEWRFWHELFLCLCLSTLPSYTGLSWCRCRCSCSWAQISPMSLSTRMWIRLRCCKSWSAG